MESKSQQTVSPVSGSSSLPVTDATVIDAIPDQALPDSDALSLEPTAADRSKLIIRQPGTASRLLHFVKRVDVLLVFVFILASVSVFFIGSHHKPTQAPQADLNASSSFNTVKLPLSDLNFSKLPPSTNASVTINGPLLLNDNLQLTPSLQPTGAKPGQIYFDSTNDQLAYYNGQSFVFLSSAGPTGLQSLGGATGQVALGNGLGLNSSQLSNTGVLSVQGLNGAVTFNAGPGLVLNGTTFANSGVLSVSSASSNVSVNTSGGHVSISVAAPIAGTGTVTSSGGSSGSIPVFTGSQNIENSIITQSGLSVNIGGSLSLNSALPVTSGGTGVALLGTNGVLVGEGTGAVGSLVATGSGLCLLSTAGVPVWATCPSPVGSGVNLLNGLSGNLSIADATGSGTTVTINNATTSSEGIASFNSTNFTVGGGAVNTIQDIDSSATPTFAGVDTNSITPSSTLTVGTLNQKLTLQGGSTSTFAISNGTNTTTLAFANPTASVTYTLQTAAAGSYNICTTAGNCTGTGGGVTTTGGTDNYLTKFNNTQQIEDSSITDDGTTVTTTGVLVVQGGDVTVGAVDSQTGSVHLADGTSAFAGDIVQGALTVDRTYTLPDASGTVCLSSGNCLGGSSGGANAALSNLSSVAINTTLLPGATTIDLGSAAAPFRNLYLGGSATDNFKLTGTATAARTITLPDASGTLAVSASGNIVLSAAGNIAFTGQLPLTSGGTGSNTALGARTNLGAAASGANGDITGLTGLTTALPVNEGGTGSNTSTGALTNLGAAASGANSDITSLSALTAITPTGALTVGATAQTLTLQGGASTTLSATNGPNTTSLAFASPTASVTYTLQTAAAGSYSICTTAGNCLGGSGGGANTSLSNLSSVAINTSLLPGTTTIDLGSAAAPFRNLYLGGASTDNFELTGSATAARTITLPDASGTVCLSSGNCLGGGSGGANTALSNLSSVAINTSLLPGTTTIDLGSAAAPFQNLYLGGTATNNFEFTGTATASRTITVPDASGTLALSASGNITLSASGNISFTGQLPVTNGGTGSNTASGARTNLGAAASGSNSDITSLTGLTSITPAAGLTIGATAQTLTLQGGASTTLSATNGANTTTLAFASPTASVTYTLQTAATGSYNICTTAGNCLGGSGGGANTSLSNLTGVAINTTLLPGTSSIDLGSSTSPFRNLYIGGTATDNFELTGTATGTRTITLPDASGTVCLNSGNCLGGSGGANTSLSNLTGVAINTSLVPGFATVDLGTLTAPFRDLYLGSTDSVRLTTGTPSSNVTIQIPDVGGTVAVTASGNIALSGTGNISFTGQLPVTSGGTGSNTSTGALTDLGAAANGANSDITSLSGLTTALSVLQGGTGAATLNTDGLLYGNGTGAVGVTAAGTTGQCLIGSTGAAPAWGSCSAGTSLQAVYNNSTSPEIVLGSSPGGLLIQDASTPLGGTLFAVQSNGGGTNYLRVTSSGIQTPSIDAPTSGALNIATGTSNATSLNLGTSNNVTTIGIGSVNAGSRGTTTTIGGQTLFASNINNYATESSNLFSIGSCSGTSWTVTTTATYTAGNSDTLTCTTPSVTNGDEYLVEFTSAPTSGSSSFMRVAVGGNNGADTFVYGAATNQTAIITASSTSSIQFMPESGWKGTLSNISVEVVTPSTSLVILQNANGASALQMRTTWSGNGVFIGNNAGSAVQQSTSTADIGIGNSALASETTGNYNSVVGGIALEDNTTGTDNAALGYSTLQFNTTGSDNVALGYEALGTNLQGSGDTAVGYGALQDYGYYTNTDGNDDTALGYDAGAGDGTFQTSNSLTNASAIGANAQVQESSALVLGGEGSNAVNVGIGTTSPTNLLSVSPVSYSTGTASQTASTTVVGSSTTWTAAMVGSEFVFANGNKYTITSFTDATHLVLSASATNSGQAYRIQQPALQVTSSGDVGVGTVNPTANLQVNTQSNTTTAFQVQNASNTSVFTVDTANSKITAQGTNSTGVVGSNLFTGFGTCSGTNWTVTSSASHTSGSASPLVCTSPSVTAGATYQVTFTLSGSSSGGTDVTPQIGGNSGNGEVDYGQQVVQAIVAGSTSSLQFIPASSWTGSITSIAVSQVTPANAVVIVANSDGTTGIEIRAGGSGLYNTFIGLQSGVTNSTGSNNSTLGAYTLQGNTTGSNNVAFGNYGLQDNTTGVDNTAVGVDALQENTIGNYNTALGYQALQNNPTGIENTAIGYDVMINGDGYYNTAIGYDALTAASGNSNVAVGEQALQLDTSGSSNVALGLAALSQNTNGGSNIAIGQSAIAQNSSTGNIAIGQSALDVNSSNANYNIAIGNSTLDGDRSNGYNIAIGQSAMQSPNPGTDNISLGYQAGDTDGNFATSNSLNQTVAIGYEAQVQESNAIVLGGEGANADNVGIGTTSPTNLFSVSPVSYKTGTATQTASTTVIGSGTTWTSAMVGSEFIFADGSKYTIVGYTSATQLTLSASATNSSQVYRIQQPALQVTSSGLVGIGTVSPSANLQVTTQTNTTTALQVQNASDTAVFNVDTTNSQVTAQGINTTAVIGSNLFSSISTCSGTNWTVTTSATHSTGSSAALVCTSPSVTAGDIYEINFTVAGSPWDNTNSVSAAIGGTTGAPYYANGLDTQVITASTTGSLEFIPGSVWGGTISSISVMQVTNSNVVMLVDNSDGTAGIQIRAGGSGLANTFVGLQAGAVDTGAQDTAVGAYALQSNTTGAYNTALGDYALEDNTAGAYNTALGDNALQNNRTGSQDIALGNYALSNMVSGSYNIAIGMDALQNDTTDNDNIAIGNQALKTLNLFGGGQNVAIGSEAMYGDYETNGNVALGYEAMYSSTYNSNVAIGEQALYNGARTGNTAVGTLSLYSLGNSASYDSALGLNAGDSDGANGFATLNNVSNSTMIGAYSQSVESNAIILGQVSSNSANQTVVGIGTNSPTNLLSVSSDVNGTETSGGTASQSGTTTITGVSVSWSSAMVGDEFVFASGAKYTIVGYTSSTQLVANTSGTNSSQNYRIEQPSLQVTSSGDVGIGTVSPSANLQVTTQTNTTAALQVQNSTGSAVFNVDTTDSLVQVGVTGLPTLANASLYVGSADVSGALLIGNSSNNVEFSGSTFEPTLTGSARHSETILLTAEYPGAVLDAGTGSNNNGTMTSDIDLTNRENYYLWTTTQSSSQSYDVDVEVPIPSNFSAWASSTPLTVDVETGDTTNGTAQLEVRDSNGVVETNDNFASITPSSTNTWQTMTAGSFSGTYTAGGYMTLRLRLYSTSAVTNGVKIGNIKLNYLSKW